jgi:hypothetical protein
MESIVALLLLLTEPTGDVTHSSTATNQILQCWMFGHWTDVWRRGSLADSGRWRLSRFELLNGRDLFIGRRMVELLEQFAFEIGNGRPFDQSD